MISLMLESTQPAADLESALPSADVTGMPVGLLLPFHLAAELERRQVAALMEARSQQRRRERRVHFWKRLATFWPVALGLTIGVYAPLLHDRADGCASWTALFLFPLSALAAQRETLWSPAATQTLCQAMLYAQLPLDGLLAAIFLRQRVTWLNMCVQVALLHVLVLLCLGLSTGSAGQYLTELRALLETHAFGFRL
jgi:hypothetical protein